MERVKARDVEGDNEIEGLMKDFTVNKRGEYYNLMYLGFEPRHVGFNYKCWNNLYFNTREELEDFIAYVKTLEPLIRNLTDFNPKHIIRMYLRLIESICSGLDVRSKWSQETLAKNLVNFFTKRCSEAVNYNEEVLRLINTHDIHYYKQWRKFEEFNDNIVMFELDFKEIPPDDERLAQNPLEATLEKAQQMLDMLIENRKDGEAKD